MLHTLYFTRNACFQTADAITPQGVMIHSTGANNPWLSRYLAPDDGRIGTPSGNHWNQPDKLCVHAFIGKLADGTVASYQVLPWFMRSWHCGRGVRGSANDTHISIEICEDGLDDPVYFRAVYREAVELTAHLCRTFGWDPEEDGRVLCHQEGHRRGVASNPGDVLHWFPKFGKTMDDFRADVARELEEDMLTEEKIRAIVREEIKAVEAERAAQPPSPWAKELLEEAKRKGITDGTRPRSFATREEVALMVNKAV